MLSPSKPRRLKTHSPKPTFDDLQVKHIFRCQQIIPLSLLDTASKICSQRPHKLSSPTPSSQHAANSDNVPVKDIAALSTGWWVVTVMPDVQCWHNTMTNLIQLSTLENLKMQMHIAKSVFEICMCRRASIPVRVLSRVKPSRFQSLTVLSAEAVASCRTSGLSKHLSTYLPAGHAMSLCCCLWSCDTNDSHWL